MKGFFSNLIMFLALAIAFSSLSGCGSSVGVNTDPKASNNKGGPTSEKPKESLYPPLISAVAEGQMEMMDGTITKISDRKGKVVLVNLWGIWCGPCRAEMPHLIQLQDKYRDKGFQVIGLNIGDEDSQPEEISAIKAFGEKTGLNYELSRAPREMKSSIFRLANFDGVPLSILVDRDGHLRAVLRGGGPAAIRQLIETVDKTMAE
jgi:thiol-disulfide isomerase/thioredoxin